MSLFVNTVAPLSQHAQRLVCAREMLPTQIMAGMWN